MSYNKVVLLLGSNLGDAKENILRSIEMIEARIGQVLKQSKTLETLPVEFTSSHVFHNLALLVETPLSPMILLEKLKDIEHEMGRTLDSSALGEYQDRVIDIDIVLFNQLSFFSEKLEIPHQKHLFSREFSRELIDEISTPNFED